MSFARGSFREGGLLLSVALAPLLLFMPVLLGGKAIFWGTPMLQFVPWWDLAWSQLLEGHLPLWNNLSGMGAPLLANYQSALFYPPHWAYLLLFLAGGRLAMAWAMALMVAAHLAFAGLGMARLVRRLGLGVLSQSLAGLAFGLCGYLVSRAGFLSINAAAAWLPWILLCLTPRHLGDGIPARQRLALSACLALQLLAGHAQTTWFTWLLAGMWVLFLACNGAYQGNAGEDYSRLPAHRIRWRRLVYGAGLLAFGILPAMLLAAVQLLPTAEYLSFSQRSSAVDYELAMTYSFWPWRLLGLFAPDMFGNPAQGDYWGYGNFWEDAVYIGLLPAILALAALAAAFRRDRGSAEPSNSQPGLRDLALGIGFRRFLILISAGSLLLALGQNTPLFPWLYRHVPGFDLFQAPSRYLLWLEVALCLAAALGAETWRRPQGGALYWTRLATAGALAVAIGAGLAWYFLGEVRPTFIRASALAGVWAIGAGVLSLAAPRGSLDHEAYPSTAHVAWQWLVIAWSAADLLVAGMGLNPGIPLQAYGRSLQAQQVSRQLSGHRLYLAPAEEQELKFGRFLRFDSFAPAQDWVQLRSSLLPNLNLLDSIASVNNFDPLLPGSYAAWMVQLERLPEQVQLELYRLMDVSLVHSLDPLTRAIPQLERVVGGRRLRWVGCSLAASGPAQALRLAGSGKVDFEQVVILQSGEPDPAVCDPGGTNVEPLLVADNPSELVISLDAPADGYLVISDTWYPGWRAWAAGREAPLLPANYLFRAVPLEKGEQVVVLRYQPVSFYLGALLSLLALLMFLVAWIRQWRH